MSGKTRFDNEIEEFDKAFSSFRNKKLIIYGTGRVTATLMEYVDQYQIIGLCDRDETMIGKELYGRKILSREQAEKEGDIIIINTAPTYWNTIYKRICDWKLPIYYRNGIRAMIQVDESDDSYWELTAKDLEHAIDTHDIISFDVFDSLVMRKIASPIDVFRIIEERLDAAWGMKTRFVMYRKQAASILEEPSLEEIYQQMQHITGWEQNEVESAKRCEIETDKLLITARETVADICNRVSENKPVYFVSDMYYSQDTILEILHQAGIKASIEQVIVSSELKRSKAEGSLWQWYKENIVQDKMALHIGDDKNADCREAEKNGIDSFYVMKAMDMLEQSTLKRIVPQIVSLQSSIAIGLINVQLFNDPFALHMGKGKVHFKDEAVAGYALLGNIVYNFMIWLLERSEKDQIDKLVFFAREAYLLIQQYRYMCKLLRGDDFPEAIYLETSRRAVWGASIESKNDLYEIAGGFPYDGNAHDFLIDRFGVEPKDEALKNIQAVDFLQDEHAFWQVIEPYVADILQEAQSERNSYLRYLESLDMDGNLGTIDSFLYGTTQFYFGKILQRKVKGYYFTVCHDSSNRFAAVNDMIGCFQQKDDISGKQCALWKNLSFIESFFTAPNGALIRIEDDLKPRYAAKMSNQKRFDVRLQMQNGIFSFLKEIVELQQDLQLNTMQKDAGFADRLFGVFMQDGFEPTDKMKTGFFYDNSILNHRETQIWG